MTTPLSHEPAHHPYPWSRGGRTLLFCPRPHCDGSAWCPEAREHLLVALDRKVAL